MTNASDRARPAPGLRDVAPLRRLARDHLRAVAQVALRAGVASGRAQRRRTRSGLSLLPVQRRPAVRRRRSGLLHAGCDSGRCARSPCDRRGMGRSDGVHHDRGLRPAAGDGRRVRRRRLATRRRDGRVGSGRHPPGQRLCPLAHGGRAAARLRPSCARADDARAGVRPPARDGEPGRRRRLGLSGERRRRGACPCDRPPALACARPRRSRRVDPAPASRLSRRHRAPRCARLAPGRAAQSRATARSSCRASSRSSPRLGRADG